MIMNNAAIANLAHTTADKLLSGFAAAGMTIDFPADVARTACGLDGIDPDSVNGQLYTSRMIGHFVNVACGTVGV